MGDPWIFLLDFASGAVYAWLLGDKKICNRRISSDFMDFHSACNFGIERLNNEVLLPTEQLLNLTNQTTKNLIFGKR